MFARMKISGFVLAVVAALALCAGCATRPVSYTLTITQSASGQAMIAASNELSKYLMLTRPPVMVKTAMGRNRVQVGVTNVSQTPLLATYRVTWLDASGSVLNGLDPKKTIRVIPQDETLLEDVSISPQAVSYKLFLELPTR